MKTTVCSLALGILSVVLATGQVTTSPKARGLPADPGFFPIAVWLQPPRLAEPYKQAGVNTYVGLWNGPTPEQITDLKRHGMRVICAQNPWAISHLDEETIVGWMHDDEPDNAQDLKRGWADLKDARVEVSVNGSRYGQYGPPISPGQIIADYRRYRAIDPSRPVFLNLGCGVAWDKYPGRGVRSGRLEDYAKYVQGCDIASFDIYPVATADAPVQGKLELVPKGVRRLREWTGGQKPVWCCIECTRIHSQAKATPAQVRSEVWMALIAGARGLIYFVHEWQPRFDESALLHDPEMLAAVTALNRQITELAPVLNSPTIEGGVTIGCEPATGDIAALVKRSAARTYLFTANLQNARCQAAIRLEDSQAEQVRVLDESRSVRSAHGAFTDTFEPYEVHLYVIER